MKLFFSIALFVVAADQFSKYLALRYLRDANQSISLIPDFFSFTYAENRGIAFGLEPAPPALLLLFTMLISAAVLWYVLRSSNRTILFLLPFSLILGGGIGNMIDRMVRGYVVDFIYFNLYNGYVGSTYVALWPIFNIADSAITIGGTMLLLFHNTIFPDDRLLS
jgi:signal peptidase II